MWIIVWKMFGEAQTIEVNYELYKHCKLELFHLVLKDLSTAHELNWSLMRK